MNLTAIENELKKRWPYNYTWYRKQNNAWDNLSSFIYKTSDWEKLNEQIAWTIASEKLNKREFFQYCCNRWYNFWSATALEAVFTKIDGINPNKNPRNRLIDFNFFGKDFDLKTSVFPNKYGNNIIFAQNNPEDLISWLYKNQSKQGRFHLENRLFLIVYSKNGQHWKLKAEISWLKDCIEKYVTTFDASQLKEFQFKQGKSTFSDIIWAVK